MKKTLTFIAVSLAVIASASAQDMYDAINFSQNFYQGTARSMGMGNAMTAVGGDLGSININPAGSAVAGYSQFTLTPSVTLSTSNNAYTPVYGTDYKGTFKDSYSRMKFPNVGFTINYKTGMKYGVKSMSFGMVSNVTNDYTMSMYTEGTNTETTMLGAMAANASGYSSSELNSSNAYYNTYAPWNAISGYQAGSIATYGGSSTDYIGATETIHDDNVIALSGPIDQIYGMQRHGSKSDIVFNFGMNINDCIYVGANLGVVSLEYQYDNYMKEYAQNPDKFAIAYSNGSTAYFDNARSRYSYNAEGEGIYLKVGVIAVPVQGLRLGAAIQTPTAMQIKERWQYANDCYFTNSAFDGYATSPEGEYSYRLRSPYRVNAGIAYTIMGMAMISADYEMADYSTMKYGDIDYVNSDTFSDTNSDIKNYAGMSHMLRIGAEFKPIPEFAIRAGYNLISSPIYNNKDLTHAFSVGAGYSSNGSFFADVALKLTENPYNYVQPYDDYISDCYSPEIRCKSELANIVATVGWRF